MIPGTNLKLIIVNQEKSVKIIKSARNLSQKQNLVLV